MAVHVYPIDEEHRLDTTCDCGVDVDFDQPELLVIHFPFDGRPPNEVFPDRQWAKELVDD